MKRCDGDTPWRRTDPRGSQLELRHHRRVHQVPVDDQSDLDGVRREGQDVRKRTNCEDTATKSSSGQAGSISIAGRVGTGRCCRGNLPIALGIWFQLKWKSEALDWIIGVEPLNGHTFL
ncbi:hypothetical protein EYF80_021610 [Liparis tanakae]|uniref:Uncharacterized protein n=1 Tax=Liparis tanakae TaxID=230148 RepID=A0A4Z2HQY2_9TELE|nr:hypothetical protein EYF80_021610 [Liparis tanakae]